MTEQDPQATQELIKRLLRPEREQELDPFVVSTFMPIEPYDHVADIGCGPGYFSIPLAKHLIHGKLYALDISDEMLDALRRRLSLAHLGNVEALKCSPIDFPVEKESLDGAFLAFVVHANEDRIAFLKAVRDLLKPRGWCTVLLHYRRDTRDGPPIEERIEPDELNVFAQEAGFQFLWWRDMNGAHYMAMLRK